MEHDGARPRPCGLARVRPGPGCTSGPSGRRIAGPGADGRGCSARHLRCALARPAQPPGFPALDLRSRQHGRAAGHPGPGRAQQDAVLRGSGGPAGDFVRGRSGVRADPESEAGHRRAAGRVRVHPGRAGRALLSARRGPRGSRSRGPDRDARATTAGRLLRADVHRRQGDRGDRAGSTAAPVARGPRRPRGVRPRLEQPRRAHPRPQSAVGPGGQEADHDPPRRREPRGRRHPGAGERRGGADRGRGRGGRRLLPAPAALAHGARRSGAGLGSLARLGDAPGHSPAPGRGRRVRATAPRGDDVRQRRRPPLLPEQPLDHEPGEPGADAAVRGSGGGIRARRRRIRSRSLCCCWRRATRSRDWISGVAARPARWA